MPASASDIKFFLSGGASNSDPDDSRGGVISSFELVNGTLENLFDVVSLSEASTGHEDYRCFYIKNINLTDSIFDIRAWIETNTPSPTTTVAIGADPAGVGDGVTTGVAVTIVGEVTAPAGVVFTTPGNAGAGVPGGVTLLPEQCIAIWVRRTISAGTSPVPSDDCRIRVRGLTA